ncbi:uncharacterized protein B0H64DRAFT_437766 [Chaetomium fimeti]|uniref:Uncharacterized protein n=1 Tax=Chaetomium fimeti TaxID=1854472 RepID=A0AAE0HQ68_9PEZI|nr:hypothetical protein B0H64DRAFT_437766 [Chaetomium fimeti]
MEQQPVCGFEGNNDLYGLGLRTGLYIQYVSLALANFLSQDPRSNRADVGEPNENKNSGIHYLRGVALVYILANFIALLHANRNRCVRDVEVVILLLELLPQLTPMVRPRPELRDLIKHYPEVSELHATVLFFVVRAFIIYQAYFWWRGIKVLPSTPCEEYIWAFVQPRRLHSGTLKAIFRVLFTILSIGAFIDALRFFRKSRRDRKSTLP